MAEMRVQVCINNISLMFKLPQALCFNENLKYLYFVDKPIKKLLEIFNFLRELNCAMDLACNSVPGLTYPKTKYTGPLRNESHVWVMVNSFNPSTLGSRYRQIS